MRLAAFTVYHEIRGEKKYKIDTSRIQDVKRITVKGNNIRHAEMYQGASYYLLEKVFSFMKEIGENKSMIDFGAGKGRAMVVAAAYVYNYVTGVDFALTLCEEAGRNINAIQKYYPGTSFNVVHEDVVDYKIENHVNTFFFFNPFNEIIMRNVLKNIQSSLDSAPRKVFVIYVNPQHKEVFLRNGFSKIVGWKKLTYIEAEIYSL